MTTEATMRRHTVNEPMAALAERDATIAALRAEVERWRRVGASHLDSAADDIAEIDRLRSGIAAALVSGNHLASLLIQRLGGGFAADYPASANPSEIAERMGYGETFDIWCGWRGFMHLRALLDPQAPDAGEPA